MIKFPLFGDDAKPDSPLNKIIAGAMGHPIILSAAATTANGLVPEGEVGFFGTTFFYTVNGNTYSIAGTLV